MKRLFAILALVGAFGLATPAWSEEATPAPTTSTTVAAPAAEAAPVAAPAEAAPAHSLCSIPKKFAICPKASLK
jgi:Amt family ammonium transporter